MHLTLRRGLALLTCLALVGGLSAASPVVNDASAKTLSKKRAAKAAYRLARRVGAKAGAVYAIAGYCKRRSAHRVNCWAGIIWSDYSGAAQRVSVVLRGGKTHARRYGRVYRGSVGNRRSGQSGGEWAICGIHSSVCIGS
jgi:hypothetical protein